MNMRELFLSRLIELIDKNLIQLDVLPKSKYVQLVNDVKKTKNKLFKGANDNHLLVNYDVISEDTVEKLVMPTGNNQHKYYAYEEELYEIISETHFNLKHAKLPVLLNALRIKYVNIPIEVVQLFLSLCHVCSQKSTVWDLNGFKSDLPQFNLRRQGNDSSSSIKSAPRDLTPKINEIPIIDISDDDDDNDREESRHNISQDQTNIDKTENVEEENHVSIVEEVSNNCSGNLPSVNHVPLSELPDISHVPESFPGNLDIPSHVITKEQNLSVLNVEPSMPINDAIDEKPDIEIIEPAEVMEPAEICLHWNMYDCYIKSVLSNFLHNEQFVDVTLACENKTIKCHKVILAMSSPYFENLFRQSTYRHPIIVLKDVYFWELQAIIEFIYTGEVKIPCSKLESLLDAASSLQIKGLERFPDKKLTKNISPRKRLFKKKSKRDKKLIKKNNQNVNRGETQSKKTVSKWDISIQTSADLNDSTVNTNLNLSSNTPQTSESAPKVYRVYTQAYIPVTNTASCQSFIPLDHSASNVASFSLPQVPCAPVTGPIPSHQSIPMQFTTIPVARTPEITNTIPQVNSRHHSLSPKHSLTLSCCSSTQTSPSRDNYSDINSEGINIASTSQENNLEKNLVDRSTKKKKSSKSKNDVASTSVEVNSLMSNGETHTICTRRKAADLQSVAKRTRKKQSEKKKKRSKYSDLYTE